VDSARQQLAAAQSPIAILRSEITRETDPAREAILKGKLDKLLEEQRKENQKRFLISVGAVAVLALVAMCSHVIPNTPVPPTASEGSKQQFNDAATRALAASTPTPSETDEQKEARQKAERDAQWAEYDKRQNAEATSTPMPEVRRAIPVRQDDSADADLTKAWNALTSQQRAALRHDERNWIKRNNSLPIEERNEYTRERANYLWSLVH